MERSDERIRLAGEDGEGGKRDRLALLDAFPAIPDPGEEGYLGIGWLEPIRGFRLTIALPRSPNSDATRWDVGPGHF